MNPPHRPPAEAVAAQVRSIGLTSVATFGFFASFVMILPVIDLWANVLPSPGRYAAIARSAAVLVSVLLAYREVRHKYSLLSFEASQIRPDGTSQFLLGLLLVLMYLGSQAFSLGVWTDLIYALEYSAVIVLLSFAFTRLAKKAYDFTASNSRLTPSDSSFKSFTAVFFASIAAVVAGFTVLNELTGILPGIIRHSAMSAVLSVLCATFFVGASYTSEFLERNLYTSISRIHSDLKGSLGGRNVVESGLGPASVGVLCLVGYLALDTRLGGLPSNDVAVELGAIALKVAMFTFIAFGLWRLGVSEYRRRHITI